LVLLEIGGDGVLGSTGSAEFARDLENYSAEFAILAGML
jgi:hypothetical protein